MDIYTASREKSFKVAATKPRLKLLLNIEELYPWMKLWDWALDHGVKGTKACQTILKFITTPLHSSICYICQKEVEETSSFPDHLLSNCSKFALSLFTISDLYNSIGTEELFTYSKMLSSHYKYYIIIYMPSGLTYLLLLSRDNPMKSSYSSKYNV